MNLSSIKTRVLTTNVFVREALVPCKWIKFTRHLCVDRCATFALQRLKSVCISSCTEASRDEKATLHLNCSDL